MVGVRVDRMQYREVGSGLKSKRMEVPPPLCQPASLLGGGEEVNNLAGGAWSGLEEWCGFGLMYHFRAKLNESRRLG